MLRNSILWEIVKQLPGIEIIPSTKKKTIKVVKTNEDHALQNCASPYAMEPHYSFVHSNVEANNFAKNLELFIMLQEKGQFFGLQMDNPNFHLSIFLKYYAISWV